MPHLTPTQISQIKGVFFGQAIGDALGLGTEFMSKEEVKIAYPNGLSQYNQIVQDKHRSRWEIGAWTDDTEQFLCICDSIIKKRSVCERAFAEELLTWYNGNPLGIGYTVLNVVKTPQYSQYPMQAAEMYWKMKRGNVASNGAIMRTSILGVYDFWDRKQVIHNSEKICKTTHFDPRCVGSSVIVSSIISNLLVNNEVLTKTEIIEIGRKYSPEIEVYVEAAFSSELEDLKLSDAASIGYTLKALSAGLWALIHATSFEEGIQKIIHEGGDADTNAAVAGSFLGAKFGFSNFPTQWVNGLSNNVLLEQKCSYFLEVMSRKKSS